MLYSLILEEASTDSEVQKARRAARDDLVKAFVLAERLRNGEMSEEEEMMLPPIPGMRELPSN